jgi:YidC/Oxa1 family membrane protein insertase
LSDYYNPQQEPGMERRLLLAFVLTFVIILITQPLLMKYVKQQEPAQPEKPPAVQPAPQPAPPPPRLPASAAVKQASAESETVIENDLYRITFSNHGGQAVSWVLKNYKDESGKPLELVDKSAAAQYGYPLSLWTYDEALRTKLASALYVASFTGAREAPAALTFEYADPDISVRKTFHFDHSYLVKVETLVEQQGHQVRSYVMWPAGFGDQATLASFASSRIEWEYGQNIERQPAKKISGGNTINGPFQWAGVADQYFAAVFLPDDPAAVAMITLRSALEVPKNPTRPDDKEKVKVELLGAGVGSLNGATTGRMFVGPKALHVLESVHAVPIAGQESPPDLRSLVDFGKYLGFIARPLFLALQWTEQYIPNWGWAIVVLTVVINIALFPLRLMSMKSAMKMQKVQPQIKAIQEKYKKYSMRDPRRQEMNQEMQALYKREKVNPAGGCLPMIIQLPFLFAFYSMLGVAIELRQAPWLWIKDLSSPDRLYVLPVLIVLTTLVVQRMTPQAGMDPAQQKMMNIFMPVMLGFISWSLAAGLSVYWITSNFIGIAQQWIMNQTSLGKEMRAEAQKRARKQKGLKAATQDR